MKYGNRKIEGKGNREAPRHRQRGIRDRKRGRERDKGSPFVFTEGCRELRCKNTRTGVWARRIRDTD